MIPDCVKLLYYKCYRVNLKRGGSYIDSLGWIKKKKATTNPKKQDGRCCQYAATVALKYGEIKRNPERVSKIKPFINKYNQDEIKYPSKIDVRKTFEKNNSTVFLNFLYTK